MKGGRLLRAMGRLRAQLGAPLGRSTMNRIVASAILSCLAIPRADAQTAQDLAGTWTLVSSVTEQGGAKVETLGPNPIGTLMLGSDGRYALLFLRRDLP